MAAKTVLGSVKLYSLLCILMVIKQLTCIMTEVAKCILKLSFFICAVSITPVVGQLPACRFYMQILFYLQTCVF